MSKNTDSKDYQLIVMTVLAILFVTGVWLWTYYSLKDLDETARGTFGDMFGGANALFSGLAFTGIIITILLQRKELSLQRQELSETREELKRSAIAQENSEKALRRQAENLKISAKLSALNTLVTHYTKEESLGQSDSAATKKRNYIVRIERILERKEHQL